MPSIEYMRNEVKNMYSSPGWARRVQNMSEAQVVAIYMKKVGGSEPKKKPEEPQPPESDIPF